MQCIVSSREFQSLKTINLGCGLDSKLVCLWCELLLTTFLWYRAGPEIILNMKNLKASPVVIIYQDIFLSQSGESDANRIYVCYLPERVT